MRFLILFLALLPTCFSGCTSESKQTQLKPGTTFEVHTVAAQPSDTTKPFTDPDSGAMLNLIDPPIITAANVDAVTVTNDENGNVILKVSVDTSGTAKLQAATAVPGSQVAVIVNGEIASAPVVRSQISSQFQITGSNSHADWAEVVE